MEGHAAAAATAARLKEEKAAEEQHEQEQTALAKSQLDIVRNNPELAKMYNDNAAAGAENLGGTLPILSVHTTGKSASVLATGAKPNDGWFFYVPSKQQFETVTARILTISRGFKAPDMNGGTKFNQLMGGIITNDGLQLPFIMFVRGIRLQNLWKFGKEAAKFTHAKPVSIPMFALTVELTTETIPTKFGDNWIVNFAIVMDPDNQMPVVVTDMGEFQFLRDMVDMLEETIEKVIVSKVSEENDAGPTRPMKTVIVEDPPAPIPPGKEEVIKTDDIPF